jgi:hypothetical protein
VNRPSYGKGGRHDDNNTAASTSGGGQARRHCAAKGLSTDALVREALDRTLSDTPERVAEPSGESRPIWEVMLDNMKDVPPEEFARLRKDGASEHDRYLYGHPKRNQSVGEAGSDLYH